jgi:hypothetical protein
VADGIGSTWDQIKDREDNNPEDEACYTLIAHDKHRIQFITVSEEFFLCYIGQSSKKLAYLQENQSDDDISSCIFVIIFIIAKQIACANDHHP